MESGDVSFGRSFVFLGNEFPSHIFNALSALFFLCRNSFDSNSYLQATSILYYSVTSPSIFIICYWQQRIFPWWVRWGVHFWSSLSLWNSPLHKQADEERPSNDACSQGNLNSITFLTRLICWTCLVALACLVWIDLDEEQAIFCRCILCHNMCISIEITRLWILILRLKILIKSIRSFF